MRVSFAGVGSVGASQEDALVGLTDMILLETAQGPVLFVVARGGGYLLGYGVGTSPGSSAQQDSWLLPSGFLQLQGTGLAVVPDGQHGDLVLVGLRSTVLQGVNLSGLAFGNQFSGNADYAVSGLDMRGVSALEMMPDGSSSAIASLRGGGLVQVNFSTGGIASTQAVFMGGGLNTERASDIFMIDYQGQTFGFVSYGRDNTVAVLRELSNGQMQYASAITAGGGFWISQPGAITALESADGKLYVIVASSGSGSLSVLELNPFNGQLTPVDHVLDSRDTRFEQASHVIAFEVNGQDYLIAAGADDGLTLFAVLPGGRLYFVKAIEGTAALPLNGITGLEVLPVEDGARIFVTTEAAPFLAEFYLTFNNPGTTILATMDGGVLLGGNGDDILIGGDTADQINGGAGDDVIIDGRGSDRMTGGPGVDTFILIEDGERDVIVDFQPGTDRLDLSSFGILGVGAGLVIIPRSWGAELRIGTEVLELRTSTGVSLSAADFEANWFVGLDRVSLEEIIIIHPDPPPPPPPPPPSGQTQPTQMPGPPPSPPVSLPPPNFPLPAQTGLQMIASQSGDLIIAGNGRDRILSLRGNDTVLAGGGNDVVFAGAGRDLVFGGSGWDTLHGEGGQDTLIGGDGADLLYGGDDHDFLLGGAGFDVIHGGPGNDVIWGGSEPDRLYGGAGDDWISGGSNFSMTVDGLFGGEGNDTLFGDAGFDFLDGGPGDDVLDGGAQADNLFGRDGNDTLFGGDGLDRLFGGNGDDQLVGGAGNDGLFGEHGNDTLWGGPGNDRFFGGPGNDMLDGGPGNDTIFGGAGFDTLIGGPGNDLLQGDFNADRFVFANGHGNDTITDFDALNIFEKIDLSAVTAIVNLNDLMANHISQVGPNVVIDTGGGNSITLLGVRLSDLDASDFVF